MRSSTNGANLADITLIDSRKPPDQVSRDRELIKFWFVWATLEPHQRAPTAQADWLHPRVNDGSLQHFLEWRWALQNLPAKTFRIDFSYTDAAANRALLTAKRLDFKTIETALDLSEAQLRHRFGGWLEESLDDLDDFEPVMDIRTIAARLRHSHLIGTTELIEAMGCSRSTARRILHDLTQSAILTRGHARGHAIYSPTRFVLQATEFAEELKSAKKLPAFGGLSRYSRSRS